tara:strand:- start:839 stop:1879 length:1041 start_codon:yes stop_codon:yes gene_type:complete
MRRFLKGENKMANSKYLETKPGSLQDAVRLAQEAAHAANQQKIENQKEVWKEAFSPKEIKMAIGIASDKRYADGNMTGAVKQIEKIAKGLSDHKQVAAVLKRQNEDVEEGFKKENNFIYAAKQAKKDGEKTFTIGGKTYDVEEALKTETVVEKVEYVEYKFKNKNDAMKAKKMLDAIQLMGFDINDDNISNGELAVDAGSKDMTKYHKDVMKQFKPKVMKTETNKNDKSDDGDGMDAVQPKAVKKKFKDRKDQDIDNDGDVDSSDKFLHKRRKAISKSMKETVLGIWQEAAKKESQDLENDKDGDGTDDDGKPSKTKGKTATGKVMTKVDLDPKMPKVKESKNKPV